MAWILMALCGFVWFYVAKLERFPEMQSTLIVELCKCLTCMRMKLEIVNVLLATGFKSTYMEKMKHRKKELYCLCSRESERASKCAFYGKKMKLQICSTLSENNNTNTTNCTWMEYKMCYYQIDKSASAAAAAAAAEAMENLHKWLERMRNARGCAKNSPKLYGKYALCRWKWKWRSRVSSSSNFLCQRTMCTNGARKRKKNNNNKIIRQQQKPSNNMHRIILLMVDTYK